MHLKFTNINDAFYGLVNGINRGSIPTARTTSRNGDVIAIVEPMIITYTNPRQRVLFNTARDANPFFHLYESLWMLAGRNDIAPLNYYCGGRYLAYSDDGKTANGAYGYRWRNGYPLFNHIDQLNILIEHLRTTPNSRRAVLQMWNVEDDLLKIGGGACTNPKCLGGSQINHAGEGTMCPNCGGSGKVMGSKDVCCNLSVLFSIRKESHGPDVHKKYIYDFTGNSQEVTSQVGYVVSYLDMTVFNRSNDLVWGALGANVVHFSMLQEYMANCLGVKVGVYNQISNNLHVYTNNWKPEEWLKLDNYGPAFYPGRVHFPVVADKEIFDEEVATFVEVFNGSREHLASNSCHFVEPFLEDVAVPMLYAFYFHKKREYEDAMFWVNRVMQSDWQWVAQTWIAKRMDSYNKKENTSDKSNV